MSTNSGNFEGKVVLITGGTTGIGLATAKTFASEGANVVIAGRSAARGEAALAELPSGVRFAQTDVSRPEEVARLVAFTVETFGGLDIAFNNAGFEALGPIGQTDDETFQKVLAINVAGVWLAMKSEIDHMMNNGGGVIVNTSSVAGVKGMAGLSAYSASKHAVGGLTKSLALECAPAGIRINAIVPGPIETPMLNRVNEIMPGAQEQFASATAMGRTGSPEEVASAVVWLCSSEASFITGTELAVDGGMAAK